MQLSAPIENSRHLANEKLDPSLKVQLGQFMTPFPIASFMASLFEFSKKSINLLDPGAGVGSLTAACMDRILSRNVPHVEVLAETWELDPIMEKFLFENLSHLREKALTLKCPFDFSIRKRDFIEDAVFRIAMGNGKKFSHAILNPPYKKMKSNSVHRHLLRKVGIETVNLYACFVALAIEMLEPGGELVAITPRSFCNGPYYKSYREFILNRCAIRHIHLFESRERAFKDDGVLQENVIIHLVKGDRQHAVKVSCSNGQNFEDYSERSVPFDSIIHPGDDSFFIHIPTNADVEQTIPGGDGYALQDIGISVSTGMVVDFRSKKDLRLEYKQGEVVPLIYPQHFSKGEFKFPVYGEKANAIVPKGENKKLFLPTGYYVLVKRFSSKEERKRVVAYVFDPKLIDSPYVAFENHWDVFHQNKSAISANVAYGLALYLNSSMIDNYFRLFSGHTQVNATDLRKLRYPSKTSLMNLGKKTKDKVLSQEEIDKAVQEALS